MATKVGISWSSSKKSHWNGRIKEIPEFCIGHCGKTKIRQGSEHFLWILWQGAGVAKNEVHCMNDSKDFQDAESTRSGNSHVTSRSVSFAPHRILEGMLRHSFISPRCKEGPPSIWDTHGISGNVFCKSRCIIISTLSSKIESVEVIDRRATPFVHSGKMWKARDQDLRGQSGPSAKDSVILSGGDSSKKQRLQISDLHFDKFYTPATFACWKMRFKT